MRILFVTHSFEKAGAQISLSEIVKAFKDQGHELSIIGPRRGSMIEYYKELGLETIPTRVATLFYSKNTLVQYVQKIALNLVGVFVTLKHAARIRPHLIYTNTSASVSGAITAKILGIPHLWNVRENFKTFTFQYIIPLSWVRYLVEKFSTYSIFVTALARSSLYDTPPKNAKVVHNGIRAAQFNRPNAYSPPPFSSPFRIGCISGLSQRRGIDTLIEAVALFRASGQEATLDIWGRGSQEYTEEMKNLIKKRNLQDAVYLKGYSLEPLKLYNQYHLIVMPSRGESFSRPALEAMASGTPILSTRCGGPEEFIEDKVTGLLVDTDNSAQMYEALSWARQHPSQCSSMAKKAKNVALDQFELSTKTKAILTLADKAADPSTRI